MLFTLLLLWLFRPVKPLRSHVAMNLHSILQPEVVIAALLILLPCPVFRNLSGACVRRHTSNAEARTDRGSCASLRAVRARHARSFTCFAGSWLTLYALLPVGVAFLLDQARSADHESSWQLARFCCAGGAGRWPSICAGLSRHGRAATRHSARCCCSMRASIGFLGCAAIGRRGIRSAAEGSRCR